jgi:hypothetical protein
MIEKGIVLKISSGLAVIRLDSGMSTPVQHPQHHAKEASETAPNALLQDMLEAEIPQEILLRTDDKVIVLLSPGHPLKVQPWELCASILILAAFTLTHTMMTGFILAHLFLFFCFLKIRPKRILFAPKVLEVFH